MSVPTRAALSDNGLPAKSLSAQGFAALPLLPAVLYLEILMERPCYQCGAAVEDGTAFCRQCTAPQIRVVMPSAPVESFATSENSEDQISRPGNINAVTGFSWSHALPSAAQAGLIAAVLMVIPLGASFVLGMLAAGFLSVFFYRRRVINADLTYSLGMRLGALSGAIGFSLLAMITSLETVVFRSGGEMRAGLQQAVEQAAARNPDPQAQQLLQYLRTPQGLVAVMVMGFVLMFFLFVILSSLGGLLGAVTLRRKERV